MKLLYTFLLISFSLFSQSLIKTIDLPNNNFFNYGYGLVAKNGYLWVGSSYSTGNLGNRIFAVDTNGVVQDSIFLSKFWLNSNYGLAWDGTDFWFMQRYVSTSRVFRVLLNGQVTDSINYPPNSYYPGGMAYERGGLWISIYSPNASAGLYKYSLSTGQVIDTIHTFGTQPQGITIKGDTLFYVMDGFEGDAERIYAINLNTKDTLFSFKVPEIPGQRQNPRGLAWDGRYLYLLAEPVGASSGRKIFKYDLTSAAGSPSINLITKSIAFGNWYIDSTLSSYISIGNTGDGKLFIDSVRISNSAFTFSPNTFPYEIPGGQTALFTVKFKPNRYGDYNDSIIIFHNDKSTTFKVTKFTGKGIYYSQFIACVDQNYNYGQKKNFSTSFKDFIIENRGSKRLVISSIQLRAPFFRDELTFKNNLVDTIRIDSLSQYKLRIWFKPTSFGLLGDSIILGSNSSVNPRYVLNVSGESIFRRDTLGSIRWQTIIPPNPSVSYQDLSAASIKNIPDVTGDGKPDIVLDAENYQLLCYNGNSSGTADLVWRFDHGYNNNNTGKVERVQALQSISDVNNDGCPDIVVGLGGGNEFVYCVSGKTGAKLWEYGDSINYSQGDINGIDAKRDFNNDGFPDVLVTASGDMSGYGRYSIYCLNGKNGAFIWQISQASPPLHTSGIVSTTSGGVFSSYDISGAAPFYVRGFNKAGTMTWSANTNAAVWSIIEVGNIGGSAESDVVVGDFAGYMYAYSGDNGALLWQKYVSGPFYTDLRLIQDINNNGAPEVFGAGPDPYLILIDSKTGNTLWSNSLGSIILGVSEIPDLNGDGINEASGVTRGNVVKVVDGATGNTLFEYMTGPGTDPTAAEKISYVGDVDNDGYSEFVVSDRSGKLICFSGGTAAISQDTIRVTAPNGGEVWTINSQNNITWRATANVTNVKIEYTTDDGLTWNLIIASTPANANSYTWTIPNTPSSLCKVKITNVNNSSLFDISDAYFTISTTICRDVNILAGWNMIAVPLRVNNMAKNVLFPTATSNAYGYDNAYITFDTLANAKGYWLKFDNSQTIPVCGNYVSSNQIPVKLGWNLIGGYHNNVPVNQITSSPNGIIISNFYEYNQGYLIASSLNSGKGYWIRVSSDGNLILPTQLLARSGDEVKIANEIGKLIIEDALGQKKELYVFNESSLDLYDLPPLPPQSAFDVRFSTDRFAENMNAQNLQLNIQTLNYPIKIRAEKIDVKLTDLIDGSEFNQILYNGNFIEVKDSRINKLSISFVDLPKSYSLSQNYPNPFNPTTTINYEIPTSPSILLLQGEGRRERSVSLKIYDILGRVVETLLNAPQQPGRYSIQWNASKYASGIYYYELKAGDFRSIKKMMLVK